MDPQPEDSPPLAFSTADHARRGLQRYARVHLCFGWWALLGFLLAGIALEAMHGLKLGFYLDVHQQTRRLMWTLGHAHGTLLALVHIAFAASIEWAWTRVTAWLTVTSGCLIAASVALPGGFVLGGVWIYDGDPGLGILLVPLGALCLLIAVLTIACRITKSVAARSR